MARHPGQHPQPTLQCTSHFSSPSSLLHSLSQTHTLFLLTSNQKNLDVNPISATTQASLLTQKKSWQIASQPNQSLDWENTKCLCIFCLMRLFKHGSSGCGCWRCYSWDKRTSRPTFARIPIFSTVLGKNRFSAGRSAPLYELDAGVSGKGDPSSQPASSQRACHLCQQSPKP
jgi:hypothetical protein